MQSVFLSYSFQDEKHPLVTVVRRIIEAVGARVIDGRVLGTPSVTSAVRDKIRRADAVVCIFTPNAQATGWVNSEYWQAFGADKRALMLIDPTVAQHLANPYQGLVTIQVDLADPLPALGDFAAYMGYWRQEMGRPVRAVLLPESTTEQANGQCEYRLRDGTALPTPWTRTDIQKGIGGMEARIPAVPDGHEIQFRVEANHRVHTSMFMPLDLLRLELK